MSRLFVSVLLAAMLLPFAALGQSPQTCAPTDRMDKYRFLRQVTLDLYGRPPTIEEYEALHEQGDVSEQKIDEMLRSQEFYDRLAEYHRGFLWTALPSNGELFREFIGANDPVDNPDGQDVWFIDDNGKQRAYRGAYVSCLDVRHSNFDSDGRPLPMQTGYMGDDCANTAEGCTMDGWVEINPYWDPSLTLRVCAFDAQEAATGLQDDGNGPTDCSRENDDPGCGCGPNLRFCAGDGPDGNLDEIRKALTEEPSRIFEGIIRAGRPYVEAFTTRETYFNGMLRHYYRYLQEDSNGELSDIDAPSYTADWELVERPAYHSGILTTMGYLLRHTSQRARINRLYTAFLCDPFVAPAGGLPPATDPCSQDPDLSTRCGCATCHATIEPATTYFGRWLEAEFDYRADLETFSQRCADCEKGECGGTCERYYITRDLETTSGSLDGELGKLKTVAFRTDAEAAAIDEGPSGLLKDPDMQGRLASCAVQNFAQHVLHRELTTNEKATWLPTHTKSFKDSNYDFLQLVKNLIQDPRYRSVE
jgi:hypothetical protein